VIDLAGVNQLVALAAVEIDAVPSLAVERKSIVSVSRWAQVFLTQLLPRPDA
jgi:hypothetical protein